MSHGSKYFNLDKPPSGWNKEEFVFAVLALESLEEGTLLELLDKFEIRFSDGNDSLYEEQMISVLFDDVPKAELLEVLHWSPNQSSK